MKPRTATLLIALAALVAQAQTLPPSLANKYVFQGNYPLTATFRGNHNSSTSFAEFVNDLTKAGSHIPDLVDINLFYDTTNAAFANQMAHDFPEHLFLQVLQANSGIPRDLQPWPSSVDRLCALPVKFPGHWAIRPPTALIANIAPTDNVVQVASASGFNIGNYMPAFPNGCPAVIVETDLLGHPVWEHYEYVYVTAIAGTVLTVTRAYRDSPAPSAFADGLALVAPLLVTNWDEPPVWYVNFSPLCPLDANGKTAAQIMTDDLSARFATNGALSNFSGVDYASGPFTTAPAGVDYDWDGTVDPEADYYTGVNSFLASIRPTVDSAFIVLSGNTNMNYIDHFNGVNHEGLIQPADPWRGISDAMNEKSYWSMHAALPRLEMEVLRIQDDSTAGISNASNWVQLVRLGTGYATCLGACADIKDKIFDIATSDPNVVALTWVELFKGTEDEEHWLGQFGSPLVHVAATTPSLLGNSTTDWANIMGHLSFQNGTMMVQGNELVLVPNSNQNHTLTLDLELGQTNDLTVLFDVISGGDQPIREIKNPVLSVPSLTDADATAYYSSADYLTREYYWRHLEPGTTSCTITFNFTGTDTIRLRSMGVHEAPDCLARSFEHGAVLVNPGLENFTFDLTALFGTGFTYTRLTAPDLTVPPEWQSQYDQTLEMNDGSLIADPTHVVVPALNALFLKGQPIATGSNEEPNGSDVTILPNPSHGTATIASSDDILEIVVSDVRGEVVLANRSRANSRSYQVDLASFAKGVYFVRVTNDNGNVTTRRIVIQ